MGGTGPQELLLEGFICTFYKSKNDCEQWECLLPHEDPPSLHCGKASLLSAKQAVLTADLLHTDAHTQVVTLAGSMVSDPSIGCSSVFKKNIVL